MNPLSEANWLINDLSGREMTPQRTTCAEIVINPRSSLKPFSFPCRFK